MSAIDDLATELSRLPGIGRKTALRLTYHLIKQPAEQSRRLAAAVGAIIERVKPCSICANLTEVDPCSICADERRDRSVICVVEEASDIGAIERSGEYRGLYHVLGGRLSPLDGVGPEDLTIDLLSDRTARGDVKEVIIATNPSLEGEATAIFIHRKLSNGGSGGGGGAAGEKAGTIVTRIARGIPVGGDLDYADGVTIAQALSARRSM